MSVKAQNWVWEHSETNGNDRLVLLYLADQGDDDGLNSFPSIRRIADRCKINTDTVWRSIQRLEMAGEVVVDRPERKGRGHFSRYTLVLGRPMEDMKALRSNARDLRPFKSGAPVRPSVAKSRETRGPDPRLPIDPQTPSGITSVDNANARGEQDASIQRFDEFFWPAYPARNGKKLDKHKAMREWVKLSIEEHRDAVRGVRNYADSGQLPKDAHRWLRERQWEQWQTPATRSAGPRGGQADAAQAIIDDLRNEASR